MTQKAKVFCLGLSRTGTSSLCAALEVLGHQSVHYPIHLFTQREVIGAGTFRPQLKLGPYRSWRRRKEIKALACLDTRKILQNKDAFGDLPIPLFYRQLDQMFPGSKFILTSRGLEGWLKSMKWLFDDGGVIWQRGQIGDELHWEVYGTTSFDRDHLARVFMNHIDAIESYFYGRDHDYCHLIIDQGDLTYDRLKAFLGVDSSYTGACPQVNEARSATTQERLSKSMQRTLPFMIVKILLRRLNYFKLG